MTGWKGRRGSNALSTRMARKLRLEFGGACYHVINRGNYRRDLFLGTGAAVSFVRCLEETCLRFAWRLHAYVVMRNHFHLAVQTPEPNLSCGMKWLQGTWALRFNRFRGEHGRPFQGRYKALHVEPGHALAQVAHYIHLNPVRAGIVSPDGILGFRWSSLPRFLASDRPIWLAGETILHECGSLADSPAGWKCYLEYLALIATDASRAREVRFQRMTRGWMIGSPAFESDLRQRLADQSGGTGRLDLLGGDRETHLQARAACWEEKLQALAREFVVDLARLPAKKSAEEKVRLAAALKATTSVTNRWLAIRLHMGAASSIPPLLIRFRSAERINAGGR
jgi:putative transposase